MTTKHQFYEQNSSDLSCIPNKSVQLIVTSPPYPMIEMWDGIFSSQNPDISAALNENRPFDAFRLMHEVLNSVWKECDRVLDDNCFICVNIGDAVRTIDDVFRLYSNHTAIINYFSSLGYSVLPDINWHKTTNAPNKFMGSGMYPAGAYVTYEHEYILIFRKGGKRIFTGEAKKRRQKSAYFWEERNIWFSDLWDIRGTSQIIDNSKTRERSASFPFEIAYRLVNMYSVEGDTVLDPFSGLGTTSLACMASQRNSIGIDIDSEVINIGINNAATSQIQLNSIICSRLQKHNDFIASLPDDKKAKYMNNNHGFPVKTRQEIDLQINQITSININDKTITCEYE